MDILNISAPSGQVFTGPSQVPNRTPQPQVVPAPKQEVPATAEKARYEEVVKAAESIKNNYFVVSDTRFTIFKDIAGDYVTRFTSLKDGSVKYFPQKSLFEMMQVRNAENAAVFTTEA